MAGVVRTPPGAQSHLRSRVAELRCDQRGLRLVRMRPCLPAFQYGLKTWKCEHAAQRNCPRNPSCRYLARETKQLGELPEPAARKRVPGSPSERQGWGRHCCRARDSSWQSSAVAGENLSKLRCTEQTNSPVNEVAFFQRNFHSAETVQLHLIWSL